VPLPRTVAAVIAPKVVAVPVVTTINIDRKTKEVSPLPVKFAVAPNAPVGTIEMSGFKPFKEDVTKISRVKADRIETDASGKMILRGNVVVELQQGQASSKLISSYITVQGGPGFHPEVVRGMTN
jgi:hypothetical protein